MKSEKILLLIGALFIGVPGLIYAIAPHAMMASNGMTLSGVNEAHTIRAAYGGGFLAFASLFALGAFRPRFTDAALVAMTFFMGGFAAGRMLSTIVDGKPLTLFMALTAGELVLSFLAWRFWSSRS